MATISGQPLLFVENEEGDDISATVRLDADRPADLLRVRWMPAMAAWVGSLTTQDGTVVVSNAVLNHLEGWLSNIVSPSRPRGDIVTLTRDGLDPGRDAWTMGGRLLYVPDGLGAIVDEAAGVLL